VPTPVVVVRLKGVDVRYTFKIIAIFVAIHSVASFADQSSICSEFRALGWPASNKLLPFTLTNTLELGAREDSVNHFYNIDIDGDDIGDEITVGCSASAVPADPCMMQSKLSSAGSLEFEAWHLFLVRHRGLIYAVTANEENKDNKIYRVGPKNINLVCSLP